MLQRGGGNPTIIQKLLRLGLDVNATNVWGETPLRSAAATVKPEAVGLLLEAGADPFRKDIHKKTVLDIAKDYLGPATYFTTRKELESIESIIALLEEAMKKQESQ